VEFFTEAQLLVNITQHVLVPRHEVLTAEEKSAILLRYKVKDTQLPRILVSMSKPACHVHIRVLYKNGAQVLVSLVMYCPYSTTAFYMWPMLDTAAGDILAELSRWMVSHWKHSTMPFVPFEQCCSEFIATLIGRNRSMALCFQ
jgi:RNA polymerase Rpb5, C-terminal domain